MIFDSLLMKYDYSTNGTMLDTLIKKKEAKRRKNKDRKNEGRQNTEREPE